MTRMTEDLSIISTERRVWLLLVDERENGAPSRVGDRIETLSYRVRLHRDAARLVEIADHADEAWLTKGPKLADGGDVWEITFERPLTKAEWYVAGPAGDTAEVSTELVARLDAINDDEAAWEAERVHRGDARLVRDLLAVDASPEQVAAALAGDVLCGIDGVQDDDYCLKPVGHSGPHQGNHAPFAADDGEPEITCIHCGKGAPGLLPVMKGLTTKVGYAHNWCVPVEPADDGEPSESELERIADNVGKPRWEQVQP